MCREGRAQFSLGGLTCVRVLESRWAGVLGGDKVTPADLGLTGGKQVVSEMLAALRPFSII